MTKTALTSLHQTVGKVISQLSLSPPGLELTFGDVLPRLSVRPKLRSVLADLVSIALVMCPTLTFSQYRFMRSQNETVVLAGSSRDPRSQDRVRRLACAIASNGRNNVVTAVSGEFESVVQFDMRSCFRRHWISPHLVVALAFSVFRKSKDLPAHVSLTILRWAIVQRARFSYAREFLFAQNPIVLVVDYDRGLPTGPLVLAARSSGIPVVSIVHGDPNPLSYCPPLADFFLFWSESQARTFESWSGRKIEGAVVGPFWKFPIANRPSEVRSDGLSNILLVHSGVEDPKSFVDRNSDLIKKLSEAGNSVRIRFHPLSTDVPESFQRSAPFSLEEDLNWSTVLLSEMSSTILDALGLVDGIRVLVPVGSTASLASLSGIEVAEAPDFLGDWREVVRPQDGAWPFCYIGDHALGESVSAIFGFINGELGKASGPY